MNDCVIEVAIDEPDTCEVDVTKLGTWERAIMEVGASKIDARKIRIQKLAALKTSEVDGKVGEITVFET